jgi:hypothetical protein
VALLVLISGIVYCSNMYRALLMHAGSAAGGTPTTDDITAASSVMKSPADPPALLQFTHRRWERAAPVQQVLVQPHTRASSARIALIQFDPRPGTLPWRGPWLAAVVAHAGMQRMPIPTLTSPTFPSASVPQCAHGRIGGAGNSWMSVLAPLAASRAKQGLLDSLPASERAFVCRVALGDVNTMPREQAPRTGLAESPCTHALARAHSHPCPSASCLITRMPSS